MQMHYVGFVDTEDMNVTSGKRRYRSLVGYTSSKLAQVWSKYFSFIFLNFLLYDVFNDASLVGLALLLS